MPYVRSSAPPTLSSLDRPTLLAFASEGGAATLRAFDLATATPLGALDRRKFPIGAARSDPAQLATVARP